MITFHIFSIFPDVLKEYFATSILKRAQEKKIIRIKTYDFRKYSKAKHHNVDDRPYGGGAGMVLMAPPIVRAVDDLLKKIREKKVKIILLSAKGSFYDQKTAYKWSQRYSDIVLICGRYEGVDERVKKILKAEEVSVGPYILTDGDIAAGIIISSVARLLPGAIKFDSLKEESYFRGLIKKESGKDETLEYPHYTRPEIFEFKNKKFKVPAVLLSGDHKKIAGWREKNSRKKK